MAVGTEAQLATNSEDVIEDADKLIGADIVGAKVPVTNILSK